MEANVKAIVERGIQMAFNDWAQEHPALAAVINTLTLRNYVVERLRDMEQYKAAVEMYVQGRIEVDLLNQVVALARQIIPAIIAL